MRRARETHADMRGTDEPPPPHRSVAATTAYVGDTAGTLHAIDRYEGNETWRYRPSDGTRLSGVAAAAHVSGRQVLFISAGGALHSLVGPSASAGDLSEEPGVRRDRVLGW